MESQAKVEAAATVAEGKKERKEREKREKRERKEKEKEEKKRAQEQKKKDKEELKQQKKREKEEKKELKRKEKEDKRSQAKANNSNKAKPKSDNVEVVATAPAVVAADESLSKEVVSHDDESKADKQRQTSTVVNAEPEADDDVSDEEEVAEEARQQHAPAVDSARAPAAVMAVPTVIVTAAQDEDEDEAEEDEEERQELNAAKAQPAVSVASAKHSTVVSHTQAEQTHSQAASAEAASIERLAATEETERVASFELKAQQEQKEREEREKEELAKEKKEQEKKEKEQAEKEEKEKEKREKEKVATFKAPAPVVSKEVKHVDEEPMHKSAADLSVNKPASGSTSGSATKKTSTVSTEIEAPVTVPASAPPQSRAQPAAAAGPKGGVASRWQQAMDDNLSAKSQGLSDQMDDRVVKGVQWMDSQIRFLIAEIKKHGKPKADGKPVISFGALFASTIDTMPALAAAISTAKKRGVVEYEGDMLLQAVHDGVEITLLKDAIKDSPVDPSPRRKVPAGQSQSEPVLSNNEKCMACGKTAYPLERAVASGKVFHKQCFKCSVCKCVLKVIDYAHLDGIFYCQTHFQQLFLMNGDYKSGFNKAAEGVAVP